MFACWNNNIPDLDLLLLGENGRYSMEELDGIPFVINTA
jgi:hypothetical protein